MNMHGLDIKNIAIFRDGFFAFSIVSLGISFVTILQAIFLVVLAIFRKGLIHSLYKSASFGVLRMDILGCLWIFLYVGDCTYQY